MTLQMAAWVSEQKQKMAYEILLHNVACSPTTKRFSIWAAEMVVHKLCDQGDINCCW